MKVMITNGYYGYHNGISITPIGVGETVEVSNSEAERLVGLGVASLVEEPKASTKKTTEEPAVKKTTKTTRKKDK